MLFAMVRGIALACSARAAASFVAAEGLLHVLVLLTSAVGPATLATRMIRPSAAVEPLSEPATVRAGGGPPAPVTNVRAGRGNGRRAAGADVRIGR
ncbi:hypothetical protein [Pseudonocardia alni]|uniref:hypothetical protein n=1 Tax=Pseudonocardia alni TaxID=33907 RepID=UPI000935B6EB